MYDWDKTCFCISVLDKNSRFNYASSVLSLINNIFLSPHPPVKNCFRVSSRGRTKAQSHSLQANDSFNKQQWISCLRQAIIQSRDRDAQASQSKPLLSPEPPLDHIAELNLNSDVEMIDT